MSNHPPPSSNNYPPYSYPPPGPSSSSSNYYPPARPSQQPNDLPRRDNFYPSNVVLPPTHSLNNVDHGGYGGDGGGSDRGSDKGSINGANTRGGSQQQKNRKQTNNSNGTGQGGAHKGKGREANFARNAALGSGPQGASRPGENLVIRVQNIPSPSTEKDVAILFEPFGGLVCVQLWESTRLKNVNAYVTFADRPTLDCVLKHFQRCVKINRGVWARFYTKPEGFKCVINEPQGNEWFKYTAPSAADWARGQASSHTGQPTPSSYYPDNPFNPAFAAPPYSPAHSTSSRRDDFDNPPPSAPAAARMSTADDGSATGGRPGSNAKGSKKRRGSWDEDAAGGVKRDDRRVSAKQPNKDGRRSRSRSPARATIVKKEMSPSAESVDTAMSGRGRLASPAHDTVSARSARPDDGFVPSAAVPSAGSSLPLSNSASSSSFNASDSTSTYANKKSNPSSTSSTSTSSIAKDKDISSRLLSLEHLLSATRAQSVQIYERLLSTESSCLKLASLVRVADTKRDEEIRWRNEVERRLLRALEVVEELGGRSRRKWLEDELEEDRDEGGEVDGLLGEVMMMATRGGEEDGSRRGRGDEGRGTGGEREGEIPSSSDSGEHRRGASSVTLGLAEGELSWNDVQDLLARAP